MAPSPPPVREVRQTYDLHVLAMSSGWTRTNRSRPSPTELSPELLDTAKHRQTQRAARLVEEATGPNFHGEVAV